MEEIWWLVFQNSQNFRLRRWKRKKIGVLSSKIFACGTWKGRNL